MHLSWTANHVVYLSFTVILYFISFRSRRLILSCPERRWHGSWCPAQTARNECILEQTRPLNKTTTTKRKWLLQLTGSPPLNHIS